jgi:hypothetical protein
MDKIDTLKKALSSKKRSEMVNSLIEVFPAVYDEWEELHSIAILKTRDVAQLIREKIQFLENYG